MPPKNALPWALYIDGACRGNPGPAGAGAVLYGPDGDKRAEDSLFLGQATNNIAEYQALLLGLKLAQSQGAKDLKIFSDSELLVLQLLGAYRVRQPHLLTLWRQAREKIMEFDSCEIFHVDRSANLEADRLARQAIDRSGGKR